MTRKMRRSWWYTAAFSVSLAFTTPVIGQEAKGKGQVTSAAPAKEEFPAVVAVVNGQTISRDELGTECLRRYGSQVLDNLLNKYLILQACQKQNIVITAQEVDEEIARIASKFGLTTKLYIQLLQDERNITAEQYSSEIVWPMLALRRLAADKIVVSRAEIDRAYESEFGARVQVRMIACKDKAKADQLHKQVSADPTTFRRVAKELSEDPASASTEGLLPPLRRFSGDDELEKIAFNLKPEQISDVFPIGGMFVCLQCVRFVETPAPSAQALPVVRQRLEDALRDEKLQIVSEGLFETLQKESKVVRVLGDVNLEKQYAGVAAFINQQPVPISQLTVEALRRHAAGVLKGEINRRVLMTALDKAKKQVSQPDIDLEIARAADAMGFINADGTPNVEEWLKSVIEQDDATVELYVRDAVWPSVALKKLVDGTVQITEEDMQRGFESSFGPRADVLAVVMSNQRTAHEVWEMARNNNTEEYFGQLATQYSIEPVSRANFGKVPPIRKYSGNPVLEEQAFQLKAGEISGIVALGEQYVIIRSLGLTKPVVQEYATVKDELYREILEKKTRKAMQDKLDELMKEAQIDNFIENTSQTGKIQTAAAPGAPANGAPTQPRR